jgi:hypothetical protein
MFSMNKILKEKSPAFAAVTPWSDTSPQKTYNDRTINLQ